MKKYHMLRSKNDFSSVIVSLDVISDLFVEYCLIDAYLHCIYRLLVEYIFITQRTVVALKNKFRIY